MDKSRPKPIRASRAQVSTPKTTVSALYRSAIGIDVHLNLLVCCWQTQLDDHSQRQECMDFYTDRRSLEEFTAWCLQRNPEIILMESTGILWQSPYEALERAGIDETRLALINARDAKAAIGRKTDRKDAARLAELARSGHFRKSFVPPYDFRLQRLVAREYQKIKSDISRLSNRYQKLLNTTGCRASTVFSDVRGMSASIILEAKIQGKENLTQVIRENCGRLRASAEMIESALDFEIDPTLADQLRCTKDKLEVLGKWAAETFNRLRQLQRPYEKDIKLLMSIPGVKETSARLIYAELCQNLGKYFKNSECFASWLGICPGDNTSAGKQKSGTCPKGNRWLRRTLVECVRGFTQSKGSPSRKRFDAMKLRRGFRRATIAIAHFLARIVYSILTKKEAFVPHETTVLEDTLRKRLARDVRMIKHLPKSGITVCSGMVVDEKTGAILAKVNNTS